MKHQLSTLAVALSMAFVSGGVLADTKSTVTQTGNANSLTVSQSGVNGLTESSVVQEGNSNLGQVSQTGNEDVSSVLEQYGSSNKGYAP